MVGDTESDISFEVCELELFHNIVRKLVTRERKSIKKLQKIEKKLLE